MWLWRKFCTIIYESIIKICAYIGLSILILVILPFVVALYTYVILKLLLSEKVRGYRYKKKI